MESEGDVYSRLNLVVANRDSALTKASLARAGKMGINTVRRLWSGKVHRVERSTVERLCLHLLCDFEDLFVLGADVQARPVIKPINLTFRIPHRLTCRLEDLVTDSQIRVLAKNHNTDLRSLKLLAENEFSLIDARTVAQVCMGIPCTLNELFTLVPVNVHASLRS